MSRAHDIPDIDRKGLREFAFILGGAVAAIFGLLLPWLFERSYPLWPWIFLGVFAVWGLLAPDTLRPVYRVWMRFGLLLNKVTTPLVLGVVFFLLILPVGFVSSVIGMAAAGLHPDILPKEALPMVVLSALSGPWPIRAITLLVLTGGWYWAADRLTMGFAADFNAYWLPGEAFSQAFFDPLLTPVLLIGALVAQAALLKWLNHQPT